MTTNTFYPFVPRSLRRAISTTVALGCSLLLASCGGGDGGQIDTPSDPIVQAESPPSTTVLAQATPDEDVERLRSLGYEVMEVRGDASSEPIADAVELPSIQMFDVTPGSQETSLVASPAVESALANRPQILSSREMPMVVGGSYAQPGQFPFVVFVSTSIGSCTGSLISPRWVKTAAHCMPTSTLSTNSIVVRIGSIRNGFGIENISADYFARIGDDTALVHLSTPSSFPAVAYNNAPAIDLQAPLTSVGFGQTSDGGPVSDLKFVENMRVERAGLGNIIIGQPGSMQTICRGDSGGPSLVYGSTGYPIDMATTSVTYSPFCTGQSGHNTTSYLAADIERIIGVPGMAFPTDNQPPNVPPVASLETSLGPTSIAIPATDPEGDPLLFVASGLPAGLSIDPATGIISGTTSEYTYLSPASVKVSVTDKTSGATRSVSFTWRVNTPGNSDPSFQPIPAQQHNAGVPLTIRVTGSDPNGDALQYTASGLPPGLSMALDGLVTGTPTRGGTFQVNAYVFDSKGGMSLHSFSWTILNRAPVLQPLPDSGVSLGGKLSIPYFATDPDNDAVTVTATGLPAGTKIDPFTATITGTPTTYGSYVVRVNASDPYGGTTYSVFILSVSSLYNRAPTMSQLQSRSDLPGVPVSIPIQAEDADGHKMTIVFRNLPTGLMYDATNRIVKGTPSRSGQFLVDYFITDAYGGKSTYPQITWLIPNDPPTLAVPPTTQALPGTVVDIPIAASDPNGHTFMISATGLPRGLIVNNTKRSITGTIQQSGNFNVVLTATDKYFAKLQAPAFSFVVSNEAPVVRSNLSSMVTLAGTVLSIPLDVYDPEGHRLSIVNSGLSVITTPSSLPPGLSINSTTKVIAGKPVRPGTYTVSLKVADIYGAYVHMPAFTWTITNQPPALGVLSGQSNPVGAALNVAIPVQDPDGHPITLVASGLPPGLRVGLTSAGPVIYGTPTTKGAYSPSITAKDPYGGASATQKITWVIS